MTITENPGVVSVGGDNQLAGPDAAPSGGRRARRLSGQPTGMLSSPEPAQQKKPRKPLSAGRGSVGWVFASVSLFLVWFVLYAVVLTAFQEQHAQSTLYQRMRETLALQTAPLGGPIEPGTPVALISSPSLGLADVVVVEGTASGDLMAGPGHVRSTVLPGQAGTSAIFGRASLFSGPFAKLSSAHAGDTITVTTGQGIFTYTVEDRRVAGDTMPPALTGAHGRLTLATADGSGRFGALSPSGVVYVDAILTGDGQVTLPGRPDSVPMAEWEMQGDPSALLPLSLALPLLLGAIIFVVFARSRWGGWQTWVVGVPLILGTLWLVSQAAIQLLPNLL
jgi:sortase A